MKNGYPLGRRLHAWLLALAMLLSFCPTPVLAAETTGELEAAALEAGAGAAAGSAGDRIISTEQTVWKYLDNNTDPAGDSSDVKCWTLAGYDDSGWKSGRGAFGAKNGALGYNSSYTPNTLLTQYIPEGQENAGQDIPAYFFRTAFDLADPVSVEEIRGTLNYDDAARVYINGVVVYETTKDAVDFSENMTYSNGGGEMFGETFQVSGSALEELQLQETGNIVAVELKNDRPSSSDIYFDLVEMTAGAAAPAEIKDLILTVGADESCRYLTWQSDAGTEQMVQWIEADRLAGGEIPASGVYAETAAMAENSQDSYYNYRAELTGLVPDTAYAYRVGGGEDWSPVYTFRTGADDSDGSFSFLFAGDPQIGAGSTPSDIEGWCTSLEKAETWFGDTIEFLLNAGDQVNTSNSVSEYAGFTEPDQMRTWTQAVNVGNHDSGSGGTYNEHYTLPNVDTATATGGGSGGEYSGDYWFAWDGMLLMSINSNDRSTAEHRLFLEQAIADYTELYGEPNWKVVTFHHSVYSTASHTDNQDILERRSELPPVFSDLGIDAVLMGHDHVYTRSYLMDGTEAVDDPAYYTEVDGDPYGMVTDPADGLVFYLTANSASGSKHYAIVNKDYTFKAVHNQENIPNLTKIDVTPDSMTFTTYRTGEANAADDIVDSFTILRTEGGQSAPILTVPGDESFEAGSDAARAFTVMEGVSARDNTGDITAAVQVKGTVDPEKSGVYTLVYTVSNAAGTASQTRTITVTRPILKTELVDAQAEWQYLDDNTDPAAGKEERTAWTVIGFDDSAWKTGAGSFGAKRGAQAGVGSYIPDTLLTQYIPGSTTNIPAYFFRTTFDLEDPAAVEALECSLLYDDGVIVYINGAQTANVLCGDITENLQYGGANEGGSDPGRASFTVTGDLLASLDLRQTGNVLAVELHQVTTTSSDIYFGLETLTASVLKSEPDVDPGVDPGVDPEEPGSNDNGGSSVGSGLAEPGISQRPGSDTADRQVFPFTDVRSSDWFYGDVYTAWARGLFAGVTDTGFQPEGRMNRAMMWTVLARIGGADLTDNGSAAWYAPAQAWVMANGVSDGTDPDGPVTREQLAAMLYRLAGSPAVSGDLTAYADSTEISGWAEEAMLWAVQTGIVNGRSANRLAPNDTALRSEACAMLVRYISR